MPENSAEAGSCVAAGPLGCGDNDADSVALLLLLRLEVLNRELRTHLHEQSRLAESESLV
jgi:hypothetical protein